ncbi:hypothetical protein L3N51_02022 [Metallosphaera sp. J1]|nr:hypothetical protein [Metallosphaera javensis (ex Hofmann et al. 2022)]
MFLVEYGLYVFNTKYPQYSLETSRKIYAIL